MKTDVVTLGTPAVGAIVFTAAAYNIAPASWGWFTIAGWVFGHIANQFANPESLGFRKFATDLDKPRGETTAILLEREGGFTARISSDIPFSTWNAVAMVVTECNYKNLNGSVIKRAFPNMNQEDRRELRNQMEGLLSPEPVGVVVVKNNHAEITYPVGRSFFKRVSRGMVYPLIANSIPCTPPKRKSPQKSYFTQHTRATHALGEGWEVV